MLKPAPAGVHTLKELTSDELFTISFTNFLNTVHPPFRQKDLDWLKAGVVLIGIIDTFARSQLTSALHAVDLLDFIGFLRSEGVILKLHYGDQGQVKGVSFAYAGGHYSGYHLGGDYTFPGMCKLFLQYDPSRHTQEALTNCNHEQVQPKMGVQGKMLSA